MIIITNTTSLWILHKTTRTLDDENNVNTVICLIHESPFSHYFRDIE
jgi:hypothetical protein